MKDSTRYEITDMIEDALQLERERIAEKVRAMLRRFDHVHHDALDYLADEIEDGA